MTTDMASAERQRRLDKDSHLKFFDEEPPKASAVGAIGMSLGERQVQAAAVPTTRVGAAEDPAEQAAEDVADKVMRAMDRHVPPPAAGPGAAPTSARGDGSGGMPPDQSLQLQTVAATEVETPVTSSEQPVRRQAVEADLPTRAGEPPASGTPDFSADLKDYLDASRDRGRPIPEVPRKEFEDQFQRSFADVGIHDDSAADVAAKSIDALAFTRRNDIYFRAGAYDPTSPAGKHLLAHELTHVMQQRSGINRKAASGVGEAVSQRTQRSLPAAPQGDVLATAPSGALLRQVVSRGEAATTAAPPVATPGGDERVRNALGSGSARIVRKLDEAALATTTATERAGLARILVDQFWVDAADEQTTMKIIKVRGEQTAVLTQLSALGYRQKLLDAVDEEHLHKELATMLGSVAATTGSGSVAEAIKSRSSEHVMKLTMTDLRTVSAADRVVLLQIMLDLSISNAAEEARMLDIVEFSGAGLGVLIGSVKALGLKQKLFDHIDDDKNKVRLTTALSSLQDPELDADLQVFNRSFFGNVGEGLKEGVGSAVRNFSLGKLIAGMLKPIIHPVDTMQKHLHDAAEVLKDPTMDGAIALWRDIFGTLGMWLLLLAGVVALVGVGVSAGVVTLPAGLAIEGVAAALLTAATWCGIVFIALTVIKLLLDTGQAGAATTKQEHEKESEEIGEGLSALVVAGILAALLRGLGAIVKRLKGSATDPAEADPEGLRKQADDAKKTSDDATDQANKLRDGAERQGGGRVTTRKPGVYEAADPSKSPQDWKFKDTKTTAEDGVQTAETAFASPDGVEGMARRSYDPNTKTLRLEEIKVPEKAKWIKTEPPLVEGKGTPTASYLTMRLMRLLGIETGSLKTVVMKEIWNLRTILEIRKAMQDKPHLTKAQAARASNSITSQEAAFTQSGHQIVDVKTTEGKVGSLREVLDYWDTAQEKLKQPDPHLVEENNGILEKFGLTREQALSEDFHYDYDIQVDLQPIPEPGAGGQAPSVVPPAPNTGKGGGT